MEIYRRTAASTGRPGRHQHRRPRVRHRQPRRCRPLAPSPSSRPPAALRAAATRSAAPRSPSRSADSRIVLNRTGGRRIDSLRYPRLTGSVVPARAGVTVRVEAVTKGKFVAGQDRSHRLGRPILGRCRVTAGATWRRTRVRAIYQAPNRNRWEKSDSAHTFSRIAVLNAVVTKTTKDEVAKTYHSGLSGRAVQVAHRDHELLRPGQEDAPRGADRPLRPDAGDQSAASARALITASRWPS